eukprot:872305-Amorphochlora_amoeboformis.AAC.2
MQISLSFILASPGFPKDPGTPEESILLYWFSEGTASQARQHSPQKDFIGQREIQNFALGYQA